MPGLAATRAPEFPQLRRLGRPSCDQTMPCNYDMTMAPSSRKGALRQQIINARNALSAQEWSESNQRRTSITLELLAQRRPGVLCIYTSRDGEPDTHGIISGAVDAGWNVLLPVITKHVMWAPFNGWDHMKEGWGGIPQPTTKPLPAAGLSIATLIITSALAVGTDGTRLGTGGGWYDSALPHRRSGTAVWSLARAVEVMSDVPRDGHDVTINGVITEAGFRPLPETVEA